MKHPLKIEGFTLEDLAREIGNLRYDKLADFIQHLSEDIENQADKDKGAGKIKLANELYSAALRLNRVKERVYEAWIISEPYMRDIEPQ
jgi:hypothetical protein